MLSLSLINNKLEHLISLTHSFAKAPTHLLTQTFTPPLT